MNEFWDFVGRTIPIFIGGGTVQLLIFILRRRSELRNLDSAAKRTETEAEQIVVSSAAQSITLANLMRDQAQSRVKELEEEVSTREAEIRQLTEELVKLRRRSARAETDLRVLKASIERSGIDPDVS